MQQEMNGTPKAQITLTETDVKQAFDDARFDVHYQPQMSLNSEGKIVGAEAFIRMNHPIHNQVKAGLFLPLVTQMGLMRELSLFVVERVADDLTEWREKGNELRVSINLPLELFDDGELINDITAILTNKHIPLNLITLEISQAGKNEVSDSMRESITDLRVKGFRISLDDFGFSPAIEKQLPDLPIDEIKIHRDILSSLDLTGEAEKTVKRALHLAASLGMEVIAVGVESEIHLNWLSRMGCEIAQGYFFGLPMIAENFCSQVLENKHIFTLDEIPEQMRLMIIEDDEQQRELLTEILSGLFKISSAGTVAEAQATFAEEKPDLMIIDVNLPDGSGIELCKTLNQGENQDMFSALFVSGEDTMQNRLRAYEAGGTDYISKPFIVPELVAKLGRLAVQQSKKHQLSSNAEQFQSVALQSMQEAAHYGDIVQFFKNLLSCRDEQAIANELFRFLERKGLKGSIQFTHKDTFTTFDQCHSTPSPIEMNVFELLHSKGRLFDFGKRTIVNDQHVSFLIKNMPADTEEHGRVRDYIAVMIEGMEARFRDILRSRLINSVFSQLKMLAEQMSSALEQDKQQQNETLDFFSVELKMSFHALDLTLDQENHISLIVDKMLAAKEENEQTSMNVDVEIHNIIEEVSAALSDLDKQTPAPLEEDLSNDVELF